MEINNYYIDGYFVNGYWWLFLLMAIGGYSTNIYW
jgi:hypothetical protein